MYVSYWALNQCLLHARQVLCHSSESNCGALGKEPKILFLCA